MGTMNLFLNRLKDTGMATVAFVLMLVLLAASVGALYGLFWVLSRFLSEEFISAAIIAILLSYLAFLVFRWIYWLFIEPFRKARQTKRAQKEREEEDIAAANIIFIEQDDDEIINTK
jgi:small-conductance mechanosensitive channel